MSLWNDLKMYTRFASGLHHFLTHPITLDRAKQAIRQRLDQRDANFLKMLAKGIYGNAKSPYLPLLKQAQVELADVQQMIRVQGVEQTLIALQAAGVYITFEEFKGRKPIIRGNLEYKPSPTDFNNPHLRHYYEGQTGGSRSAGTRVPMELDHIASQCPYFVVMHNAHRVQDGPVIAWLGTLPDPTGFNFALHLAGYGRRLDRWTTPLIDATAKPEFKHRFAETFILTTSRISGLPLPRPEPVTLHEASDIARWIKDALDKHGRCFVAIQVSRAVRVALAAQREGIDLTGAMLWGGGEPPTPAKIREVEKTGARWAPGYWFVEAGTLGQGCGNPEDVNDLHFFRDSFGLITMPYEMTHGQFVDAFCFTTLLPTAPKLMLNVQSDDYGIIENRSCGCMFEECGLTEHLRHVRSFSKLTGEAVTLVGSDMIRVLEEVLPARFGGSPLDYQLMEEEDPETAMTRLSIAVSPSIQLTDEKAVVDTVLDALRGGGADARIATALWEQAGTLRVKRTEPIWTARGKLLPLHSPKLTQF